MTIPFTYLIGWPKENIWYYGCRYAKNCKPENLWKSYFTSSKYVKEARSKFGEPSVIQIRKTFKTGKEAVDWEKKVLRRMKVVQSSNWLNKNIAGDFSTTESVPNPLKGKTQRIGTTQ